MGVQTAPLIQKTPRQVLNKGRPGSRVTFFPSRKMGKPVACGNLMQADFCLHLEYRRDVKGYECRPDTLQSEGLRFKADFLLTRQDDSLVYVKLPNAFQGDSGSPEWKQKIKDLLLDDSATVEWLLPEDMPRSVVSSNLRYLYFYSFGSQQRAVRHLCELVSGLEDRCATMETLLTGGTCTQDLCQAIFQGALSVSLEQKLSLRTVVYARSA